MFYINYTRINHAFICDISQEHLWIPLKDIEIHELVGEGSFGAVHKGIWNGRGGGTLVAIKKVCLIFIIPFYIIVSFV